MAQTVNEAFLEKNKGRHGIDPPPLESLIIPIADTNCFKVLQTCLFLSSVTTVTIFNIVTNVTTV